MYIPPVYGKLGFFYFINKACFTFNAMKKLVEATFLSMIDYCCINITCNILYLDSVYSASLVSPVLTIAFFMIC